MHETPDKCDKKGLYPLKVHLDCNGERMQFTISKVKAHPAHWDKDKRRLQPFAPDSAYINAMLDNLQERYNQIRLQAEIKREYLSTRTIKSLLLCEGKPRPTIVGMVEAFLKRKRKFCEVGKLTNGSYKGYVSCSRTWVRFFKQEGIQDVQQLTPSTQDALFLYLLQGSQQKQTRNPHNGAVAGVKKFKTFLFFCLDNQWIDRLPFNRPNWQRERVEKVYLEDYEIETLRTLPLSDEPYLAKMRDIFLFSCATGLAYSDLKNINESNLCYSDGEAYLHIKRQKTGVKGYIPLSQEAQDIFSFYEYSLPIPSPRYYNVHLKMLAKLAQIDKHITSHTGRKTFGNQMLNKHNVPLEVVSSMLCHRNTKITQEFYTEVSIEKVHKNVGHIFQTSKQLSQLPKTI